MAITPDLDLSMAQFVQFKIRHLRFNQFEEWTPANDVIVQFSSNGGVHWIDFLLLKLGENQNETR